MALPLLHSVAGITDFYFLWYDQKYVNVTFTEGLDGYPFKNRFLLITMWTLAIQTIYMGTACLNDLIGTNEASPKNPPTIRKIKDAIFTLAYASGNFSTLAFWGIYLINRDLIFPEYFEKFYPPWMNHIMHTTVSIFMNVEMFASNCDYPSKKVTYGLASLYIIPYLVIIFTAYIQTGLWPYVILNYFNWPGKLAIIFAALVTSFVLVYFGESLNRKLSCKVKSKKL